jgi:hypothetical protein
MTAVHTKIRVQIDNSHAVRENARLARRAEQCDRVARDLEVLLDSGVPAYSLVQLPSVRRNEVRFRVELSEPYWQLLEREAH